MHALQPLRVGVERQQVEVGQLEQVRGLAAGRGAGVEHARAGLSARQPSSSGAASWAAASCTETSPSAKPGNPFTGNGLSSTTADAVRADRVRAPIPCAASRAT